jgi:hypothetical protein
VRIGGVHRPCAQARPGGALADDGTGAVLRHRLPMEPHAAIDHDRGFDPAWRNTGVRYARRGDTVNLRWADDGTA